MTQNTTSAVMQQDHEPHDSLGDFPTPPWATRAVLEHVIKPASGLLGLRELKRKGACEPCCNRGFMARPLIEYFRDVMATDIMDYGWEGQDGVYDFLFPDYVAAAEWFFFNPPFRLALEFIEKSFEQPNWQGTACIVRTAFLEGGDRYDRLFSRRPPMVVAPHVERVIMHKGVCRDPSKLYWDAEAIDKRTGEPGVWKKPSTATSYMWLVWMRDRDPKPMMWIPPCRRQLERVGDYDAIESAGTGLVLNAAAPQQD